MQCVDGGCCEGWQQFGQGAEGGGDQDSRAAGSGCKDLVAASHGSLDLRERNVLVGHQGRLVQLHPTGARGTQAGEQFGING